MYEVSERPTEGQWVEMWNHDGRSWAEVLRMGDSGLERYDGTADKWTRDAGVGEHLAPFRFFVGDRRRG